MNSEIVEAATEVKKTIVATEVDAIEPALIAAITIEDAAVAVFKALTSPKACAAYRSILQAACLAIVFMALLVGKAARWCWENRDKTAVYHWIRDAIASSPSIQWTLARVRRSGIPDLRNSSRKRSPPPPITNAFSPITDAEIGADGLECGEENG